MTKIDNKTFIMIQFQINNFLLNVVFIKESWKNDQQHNGFQLNIEKCFFTTISALFLKDHVTLKTREMAN